MHGGPDVQVGPHNRQVNQPIHNNIESRRPPSVPMAGPAVSQSAYLQQVKRIAPPDLIGRKAELAELAGFCLEPDRGSYVWWQAEAWAGKSALLATFVLRPPPEVRDPVRIVSFFITARLAAQDTREAFTQALLEQLAKLTRQDLPPALPESSREAYLLDLLDLLARLTNCSPVQPPSPAQNAASRCRDEPLCQPGRPSGRCGSGTLGAR